MNVIIHLKNLVNPFWGHGYAGNEYYVPVKGTNFLFESEVSWPYCTQTSLLILKLKFPKMFFSLRSEQLSASSCKPLVRQLYVVEDSTSSCLSLILLSCMTFHIKNKQRSEGTTDREVNPAEHIAAQQFCLLWLCQGQSAYPHHHATAL